MSDDSDKARQFEADVIRRLEACGVSADRIDLRYLDELQDYQIAIDYSALSREQVAQIVASVERLGVLAFSDVREQQLHAEVIRDNARASLDRQLESMPDLPHFDSDKDDVADFLKEIEAYCGLDPGSTLEVRGNTVRLCAYPRAPEDIARCNRAMIAAMLALRASRYGVGVIGGT